ncbi:hypothetical protein [Rhodopila sp.]|uniref:hypothetical protein n=1 Tax=Rhodopila sp. TaxID=2480087 RepID=UPI003D0E8B27
MEITVPYQDRTLESPSLDRVRRLRRHLVRSLRDLRVAKHPDRLIQPYTAEPEGDVAAVLRAGCAACHGHCCLGGGEHAYLDERTMARVRRDRPDQDARGLIAAYVRDVAPMSYAGSCLFHGANGCTLDRALRADLCISYHCDGLTSFLRQAPAPSDVIIHAVRPGAASVRPGRNNAKVAPGREDETDG